MIAGRYEPLENGLARDTELDRVVRLRWLAGTDVVDDPRLSHPNVVRVFDIGEEDGRRFAAVEHVQGLPLALVAPLPAEDAVRIGLQSCRALAAAHDLGLVHAGEVLVRQDGVPKLAGFRPGEPGDDVRALAAELNDACPELPPLTSDTTTGLSLELERARPTLVAAAPTLVAPAVAPPRRRRRLPYVVAVVAAAAIVAGLAAAFWPRHSSGPQPRPVAQVQPVPHAPTAEQQARNLARWLSRYSP
jgi:hypothetical protein